MQGHAACRILLTLAWSFSWAGSTGTLVAPTRCARHRGDARRCCSSGRGECRLLILETPGGTATPWIAQRGSKAPSLSPRPGPMPVIVARGGRRLGSPSGARNSPLDDLRDRGRTKIAALRSWRRRRAHEALRTTAIAGLFLGLRQLKPSCSTGVEMPVPGPTCWLPSPPVVLGGVDPGERGRLAPRALSSRSLHPPDHPHDASAGGRSIPN